MKASSGITTLPQYSHGLGGLGFSWPKNLWSGDLHRNFSLANVDGFRSLHQGLVSAVGFCAWAEGQGWLRAMAQPHQRQRGDSLFQRRMRSCDCSLPAIMRLYEHWNLKRNRVWIKLAEAKGNVSRSLCTLKSFVPNHAETLTHFCWVFNPRFSAPGSSSERWDPRICSVES